MNDLADATIQLLLHYSSNIPINIGAGQELSVRELAETISPVVGYEGHLSLDLSKLDGAPRKLFDLTRLENLGWSASTPLGKGLQKTYEWYLTNSATSMDKC